MDQQEVGIVKEILLDLLAADNTQRKDAELKLSHLKENSMEKYMAYMIEGIRDTDMKSDARCMAAVLMRRSLIPPEPTEVTVWMSLSGETKDYIKEQIIALLRTETEKVILNKIAELAAEIAICINDGDRHDIWPDLFKNTKEMIATGTPIQIEAGLNVYTETLRTM
mmetsp:Transcript_34393/g.39780  ORF Transcript_34393/g.39780 Transcript_34393/m.39780 type:complete len:167 (-) Transcript_34393:372-872(-)